MVFPRFGFCFGLALCFAGHARPIFAEPAPALTGESGRTTSMLEKAVVVLVGAAGNDPELRALLQELLDSRGVKTQLLSQPSFGKDELLRETARDGAVHVFIVPGSAGNVGLYFRRPDGERFLLRNVLLRGGWDDVGRELVGQIVETAVTSLLHSSDGLTREQAQLALSTDAPPGAAAVPEAAAFPATSPPPPVVLPPRQSPKATPRTTALEGWFGLRYGATSLGSPLGLAHGPGLELGVAARRGWLLRARATGQRDFAQTFTTALIGADISSLRWRLALDAGLTIAVGHDLLVSLGAGQDRSQIEPKTAPSSAVAPAPKFQDTAPVVRAELRYEVGSRSVRAGAALGIDASLVETHYDVAHPGDSEQVVRPWLVRPIASLSLAFCPTFAKF